MSNPERSRRRRRDLGLAQVGKWTRRAVAAGVVFSGVVGAGLAHLLPSQATVAEHRSPPATSTEDPSRPATTSAPRRRHPRRLAPPSAVPRPTHSPTHATSGGS